MSTSTEQTERGAAPAVSVIMPAYNCERYVRESIESILNQTLSDLELIIVEDSSTDGTAAITAEYAARDPRVRVIHRGRPGGAGNARNAGIEVARGDLMAFQDADDTSAPEWLEGQKAYLDAHPEVGFVASAPVRMDVDGNVIGVKRIPYRGDELLERMRHYCYLCHCGALFRTRFVREIGGYRDGLAGAEDYDLILRLIEKVRVHVSDTPVYRHRQVPSGLTYHCGSMLRRGADVAREFARQRAERGGDDYEEHMRSGRLPIRSVGASPAGPGGYEYRLARTALDCGGYRAMPRSAWRGVRERPAWAPKFASVLVAGAAHRVLRFTGTLDWFERTFRGR